MATRTYQDVAHVITLSPQMHLTLSKEFVQNVLKLAHCNRSSQIEDLVPNCFSSARVVPVHFPFKVAPQIKITNAKMGGLRGHNPVMMILSLNTSCNALIELFAVCEVAPSCWK
jgi:hypothetical protein